ncbi:PspC domain-containing protein [Alkalihalobacillus sp. NPDC078783]
MKKLYRSQNDRKLAGVCGGLAEQYNFDVSLLRIIWALLVIFTSGTALLIYIIMALVVPNEEEMFDD